MQLECNELKSPDDTIKVFTCPTQHPKPPIRSSPLPRNPRTSAAAERSQPSPLPEVPPHRRSLSPEGMAMATATPAPLPPPAWPGLGAQSWRRLPGPGRCLRRAEPGGGGSTAFPAGSIPISQRQREIHIYTRIYIMHIYIYMHAFSCLSSSPPPPISFFVSCHPLSSVRKKRRTKEGKKKKKQTNQ